MVDGGYSALEAVLEFQRQFKRAHRIVRIVEALDILDEGREQMRADAGALVFKGEAERVHFFAVVADDSALEIGEIGFREWNPSLAGCDGVGDLIDLGGDARMIVYEHIVYLTIDIVRAGEVRDKVV